jgi:hypothetical protein
MNHRTIRIQSLALSIFSSAFVMYSCKTDTGKNLKEKTAVKVDADEYTTYGSDLTFMKEYTSIIELSDESGGIVSISPALQGRVMTSSARGKNGRSYGWINRKRFESKDTMEHINAYGGEERFWLGPEGGQYSIFFEKGAEFTLENWYTPRLMDLEPFEISSASSDKAVLTKKASLKNYSGFQFYLSIKREVVILSKEEIVQELGIHDLGQARAVAYRTTNILTNTGNVDWRKDTGLLSIWLLGMFNPSPSTTIVIPYNSGNERELGTIVNDNYFGIVPSERLVVKENTIYFKGDGEYRSKIGLSPMRAKNIMGSYDTENNILTIVKYNRPEGANDYVNSLWEIQERPYEGDAVNSYNDGPSAPGEEPLGPFYELETSSPALALKPGESGTHIQLTCHIEGDPATLDLIVQQLLGVSLEEIEKAFN